MYMFEYIYVYKEVLNVSTRKGTTICKFAQNWSIYKRNYDIIYDCEYMHVYKEHQSVGTCKGTNIYVSSHKAGSYIKASVI